MMIQTRRGSHGNRLRGGTPAAAEVDHQARGDEPHDAGDDADVNEHGDHGVLDSIA